MCTILIISVLLLLITPFLWFTKYEELKKRNNTLLKQNDEIAHQKKEILKEKEKLQKSSTKTETLGEFKRTLTGLIIHDLKNPLNSIINFSEKSSQNFISPEKAFESINQSGKQMLNMVLNMLDVQKFGDASIIVNKENFSVYEIINKALEQVHFLLKLNNFSVRNFVPFDLQGHFDIYMVERVFVNLLTNAIKYTPQNGQITFKSKLIDNQMIMISVMDTGPGIDEEFLETIFDRFNQVENYAGRSSGLGLTYCKFAVEAHGGKIGVKSEVGVGTTFWLTIPLGKESVQEEIVTEIEEKQLNLTEEEKKKLKVFLPQFSSLEVYEVSDLRQILKKIQPKANTNLFRWKEEISNAIAVCNTEQYEKLINKIR